MPVYLVSCALRALDHNYEPLWEALDRANGRRAMDSTWLVDVEQSLEQLTTAVLGLVTPLDGVFIHEIAPGTTWSATRLLGDSTEWLRLRRP